jgi:hypothetical protein
LLTLTSAVHYRSKGIKSIKRRVTKTTPCGQILLSQLFER